MRAEYFFMIQKLIAIILILSLVSCATVISGSRYQIAFNSNPDDALVEIRSGYGLPFTAKTPFSKVLDMGQDYTISISKPGYKTQIWVFEKKVNLWFVGSILLGVWGILIDALTGSLKKPVEDNILVRLVKEDGESSLEIIRQRAIGDVIARRAFSPGEGEEVLYFP